MGEAAVSLHLKKYSDRPRVVIDSRTGREYPADDIKTKILDAGFVVLQVAVAQIEGIEQHRRGVLSKGQSSDFLCSGLKRIFSLPDMYDKRLKDDFYPLVRCGLFHDGMTRHRVAIENRFRSAIRLDSPVIRISPNKFLNTVRRDFAKYIVELKKPANVKLRENFLRRHDVKF